MEFHPRDIFLKIEPLASYSPLAPVPCARHIVEDRNANEHRGQFHGRVRRLFQLLFGNRRITAAKISSGS